MNCVCFMVFGIQREKKNSYQVNPGPDLAFLTTKTPLGPELGVLLARNCAVSKNLKLAEFFQNKMSSIKRNNSSYVVMN
jgi:hypothetical protein